MKRATLWRSFGSKEAELGYCLYAMGCKGPETYNNCPTVKFNNGTSLPHSGRASLHRMQRAGLLGQHDTVLRRVLSCLKEF